MNLASANVTERVNGLIKYEAFCDASLRLLTDLVEKAAHEGHKEAGATGNEPAHEVRRLKGYLAMMEELRGVSPSLYASLDLERVYASLDLDKKSEGRGALPHLIWVCERPRLRAPVEAFTQLLAASVARDFDEPVMIVVSRDDRVEAVTWKKDNFAELRVWPRDHVTELGELEGLFELGPRGLRHLFFVNASQPSRLAEAFEKLEFHRIVYVTDELPKQVPRELAKRLTEGVRCGSEVYFSSFIPAVLPTDTRWRGGWTFRTECVMPGHEATPREGIYRRLERDALRLSCSAEDLGESWRRWREAEAKESFPSVAFREQPGWKETASRWGRSVTNRRVGIALSGGGASSYRIVPLLQLLGRWKIPIDVVGGVSGGALMGAYYCKGQLEGLNRAVANGWWFQLVVLGALFDSRLMRLWVDRDLEGTRIEDLAVRFVPLTTALAHDCAPEARVVVEGTLGEGVRASGAAPLFFAPDTKQGVRYVDGGTEAPVPARLLRYFGADLAFACNVVPGPARRNPMSKAPFGEFVYRHTPLGRLIDLWVSTSFLYQRVSQEAAEDANCYFEPRPQDEPMLETVFFKDARRIVEESANSRHLRKKAEEFRDRWYAFSSAARRHSE